MRTIEEFENALEPDKHDLDTELMRQPQFHYMVNKEFVRARAARKKIKLKLENLISDLDKDLRQAGDSKVTGRKREIDTSDEVRQLKEELLEAETIEEEWGALKEGFEQKSYSLKELTQLYSSEYFVRESGGYESRKASDALATKNKEATAQLRRQRRSRED